MNIREAKLEDAERISSLIHSVAHYFTLEPDGKGAEQFLDSISPAAIGVYISSPEYYYLVAIQNEKIAGVVALKEGTHLFHLFVAPEFQKKGLSRQLWEAVQTNAKVDGKEYTVNSTPYAVPIYEKLGFTVTGPRKAMNGIAFVPMKKCSDKLRD